MSRGIGVVWLPQPVVGVIRGAVEFDGTNTLIFLHDPAFEIAQGTVSFWVRSDDPTNPERQGLWSKDSLGFTDGGHFSLFVIESTLL